VEPGINLGVIAISKVCNLVRAVIVRYIRLMIRYISIYIVSAEFERKNLGSNKSDNCWRKCWVLHAVNFSQYQYSVRKLRNCHMPVLIVAKGCPTFNVQSFLDF
jgi:hypothetical protein